MARPLFNEIVTAVIDHDPFFHNNIDCIGKEGISGLLKCISLIRQLAYGVHAEFLDEYMQISERTSRMALNHFCQSVMQIYGPDYLRKPTVTDVEKLYLHHKEKHGFSRMLGSLDCMDWEWFGCPYAFKAQYVRRDHGLNPFILLEAVASQDLWIWHAFFGVAGPNIDINVLYQSPLFNDLKTGRAPKIPFVANGVTYPSGYYLVDGIYPELAPLVKTIPEPGDDDHKRILYKQKQESVRKDVEQAFGVLTKKWAILANPTRELKKERIINMMSVESVKNHFGPSKYEDPQGALSKLLQLGTVEDYKGEFEKPMNRIAVCEEEAPFISKEGMFRAHTRSHLISTLHYSSNHSDPDHSSLDEIVSNGLAAWAIPIIGSVICCSYFCTDFSANSLDVGCDFAFDVPQDTTMSTYLVTRSPSSAIGFKTPIDMLGFFCWLASIKQGMLEPVKVKCIFLGYRKCVVGNKALKVISKWKAGLKDDMDGRSDVYVLSNGGRKCSNDSDGYYWEYTPAKGNLLGMEIVTDRGSRTLKVSQSGYMQEILNNYRMDNGKSVSVPLGAHFKVSLNYCPLNDWDVKRMSKVPYTNVVGLVYGRDQGKHLDVDGFVDADYAKDHDKGRSITGYVFT
ncbi:ALP1-like protein [Tanacetum coccineum]